jgi:hypothetical protein
MNAPRLLFVGDFDVPPVIILGDEQV